MPNNGLDGNSLAVGPQGPYSSYECTALTATTAPIMAADGHGGRMTVGAINSGTYEVYAAGAVALRHPLASGWHRRDLVRESIANETTGTGLTARC